MKNTIQKMNNHVSVNLLNLKELENTCEYCQSKYDFDKELSELFNVDYTYILVDTGDDYINSCSAYMRLVKVNNKGCKISETVISGTYYDHDDILEFDFINDEDIYTNYYEEEDYEYSYTQVDIINSIPNFKIDDIIKYKKMMNDLQNEGFFEDEHDESFQDKYNKRYELLLEFQKELNELLGDK